MTTQAQAYDASEIPQCVKEFITIRQEQYIEVSMEIDLTEIETLNTGSQMFFSLTDIKRWLSLKYNCSIEDISVADIIFKDSHTIVLILKIKTY